jgi:hypothetical protein
MNDYERVYVPAIKPEDRCLTLLWIKPSPNHKVAPCWKRRGHDDPCETYEEHLVRSNEGRYYDGHGFGMGERP